ncbi:hypothetical protein MMC14_001732 [Varicellaria rhodocarpa]|nr:hypothetical protein [Varicellaria rhodocarpa]
MKQMQRDPLASTKARKAERKADEKSGLITIKPVKIDTAANATGGGAGGGFKKGKGGFRNAFGGEEGKGEKVLVGVGVGLGLEKEGVVDLGREREVESESEDSEGGYEAYDPLRPTDCWEGCGGRDRGDGKG